MVKIIIVWVLATLFTANSIYITLRTHPTLGTYLMWGISAALVVYGVFAKPIDAFTSQGAGRVLKYIVYVGMLFFAGMFTFVAASGYANTTAGDERAIIVLGAGLNGRQVGDVLRRRLDAGYDAWVQNQSACIVVAGGKGGNEEIAEAQAMRQYLLGRGVPAQAIVVEDKSTTTKENLQFTKQLLLQRGIQPDEPVAVATNAFHCYRARRYAQLAGFANVRQLPASMHKPVLLQSYIREIFAILYFWVFAH